jgi:hypothetical protein
MQLPESLAPWREWLDWFAPELAAELGGALHKFEPLLGRFQAQYRGDESLPEGLGELQRRGPYQHLLASEWLLAEEAPDEFLRRAGSGEHLFLAPRPAASMANRNIVALFDAGPLQLGAPRLAHLALWILLARRARGARGELRWGLLQAETPTLNPAETAHDLKKLLDTRCYTLATPAHWQAWQAHLGHEASPPGECWIIGPGTADTSWRGSTHRVRVVRSLGDAALDVELAQPVGRRRLELPLLDEQAARHLLQGQFVNTVPALPRQPEGPRFSVAMTPVFGPTGDTVIVPLMDQSGALAFSTRRDSGKQARKPQVLRWRAGVTPVALVGRGRGIAGMLVRAGRLTFWRMQGFPEIAQEIPSKFMAAGTRGAWLPAAWVGTKGRERFYAIDHGRRLLCWVKATPGLADQTHLADTDVLAMVQADANSLVYAKRKDGQLVMQTAGWLGKTGEPCSLGAIPDVTAVLFARAQDWLAYAGACAVRLSDKPVETWRIYSPGHGHRERMIAETTLPQGWRGIGLYFDKSQLSSGLVVLGRERNAIALVTDGRTETLHRTGSRIVRHNVCPSRGLIAMLTDNRELIVYAIADRSIRLHVQHKVTSDDA